MVPADDPSEIKRKFGIPSQLSSCHTAVIGDYFVEGHVPAEDIRRLLSEKPNIRGLAVPGMPGGSPGMEDSPAEHYQVISVGKDGSYKVFARH